MNRTLVTRLCLVILFGVLAKIGWDKTREDEGMFLVYFLSLGIIAGLLGVKYLLPWFGDAVGNVIFSSGERVNVGDGRKAAAKLAQGDYEGAIEEHEKTLQKEPEHTFPIAEMARICADKLDDPQRALRILDNHLAAREWPEDDHAFLQFRRVDLFLGALKDPVKGRDALERIMADFTGTRHAANARHKLNELEQAEYKHAMEQRRLAGKPPQL